MKIELQMSDTRLITDSNNKASSTNQELVDDSFVEKKKNIKQIQVDVKEINDFVQKFNASQERLSIQFLKDVGVLQAVISEKPSGVIIRKVPADEVITIMKKMDDYIGGLFDEEV